MFKNATIYRYGAEWIDAVALTECLAKETFNPCGATQAMSVGFLPVRTPNETWGPLAESVQHQVVAMFAIEKKTVPADALNKAVDAKCAAIQQNEGRNPGKKERRDLRDEALTDLLPQAFPRRTLIPVWFDAANQRLVVGTVTQSKADDVINSLVRCDAVKTVRPLQTTASPMAWMASMFVDIAEENPFYLCNEFDLQGSGDEPPTIRFRNESPEGVGIFVRVNGGQLPIAARLEHQQETRFTLTHGLQLKRIVYPVPEADQTEEVDRFDAEVVLETGLLGRVISDLIDAMGGEVEPA